jgi:hypothetical protein
MSVASLIIVSLKLYKQDRLAGNPVATFRTSVRPSNINGSIKQAGSLREAAERIQVYDKLCTSSLFAHEDRLFEFFQRFNVPIKEKRKKVMLSEIVCKF